MNKDEILAYMDDLVELYDLALTLDKKHPQIMTCDLPFKKIIHIGKGFGSLVKACGSAVKTEIGITYPFKHSFEYKGYEFFTIKEDRDYENK